MTPDTTQPNDDAQEHAGEPRKARSAPRPAVNFTDAWVKAVTFTGYLKTIEDGEALADRPNVWIRDAGRDGLQLCVSRLSDQRTFYIRYRVGPRSADNRTVKLGVWGKHYTSVDAVRKMAAKLFGEIAGGKDPSIAPPLRQTTQARKTVGDLFRHFLEYAKLNKRSWEADQKQWEKYLAPDLEHVDHGKLSSEEVDRLHKRIGKTAGHYTANRCLSLLKTVYSVGRVIGAGENPCRGGKGGIVAFPETTRDRYIKPDEMPAFIAAVDRLSKGGASGAMFAEFFLLLLYTGQRRANVQAMKWADVDLVRGEWKIPAEDFKGKRSHSVALVPQAVKIIEQRRAIVAKGPWVFPSRGESGHLEEPKGPWKKLIEDAKLEGLRIHDLRRTHGSYMASLNISSTVIGAALGHKSPSTTAIYSRVNLDPVRAAAVSAVNLMHHVAESDAKPTTATARKPKKRGKARSRH